MASGVPQSFYIDEFADEGIMFEGAAGPPDYLASSLPFTRERHRELMLRFLNLAQFGVMVSDLSRGSVRERAGRTEIRYDLCEADAETFRTRDLAAGGSLLGGRGEAGLPAGGRRRRAHRPRAATAGRARR